MTELVVELYGRRIGTLVGERGSFDFFADAEAVEHYGIGSPVLSFAVPLTMTPRRENAPLRANFFEEVLAEAKARERLSTNARLDYENTMALLARYGRDVAGALQVWDPADAREPRTPALLPASAQRVREMLEDVKRAPIGNVDPRHMSSLAGVQDKIVLVRTADGWGEAVDGFASTHIVKPVAGDLPSLIFDEEYGARLARHLGLASFDTHIEVFDGMSALVIERYDRESGGRVHQEDFNQALGFSGDAKYEANGHSGLASIARVLREQVGRQAVIDLLRMTTMSVAVGNLDMHAKNISVLHLQDKEANKQIRLAPMYDVVPQMHQPFDKVFAFRINGIFSHAEITIDDLIEEGRSWGLRGSAEIVNDTLSKVAAFVSTELPVSGAHFSLAQDIARFTKNLMAGRGASATPNDGTSGSFFDKTQPEPEVTFSPLPVAEGGWGGPARR